MHFTAKKLFLVGFVVLLLVGIPVSVYFLQKQQGAVSRAEKATNLTFAPDSSASAPITKSVGDDITLDVTVEPGTNLVSFVKLEIQYDPEKIATASSNAFAPNSAVFPSVLEGPVYSPGKIAVTLSVGPDPTKAIQTKIKAATLTFKAIAGTAAGTPTLVTYSTNTQALSIGTGDQASENVLAGTVPATIVINGGAGPTATLTPTVATGTPTETATPTLAVDTGTPVPTDTGSPTPSGTPGPTTATSGELPVCTTLTVDRAASGTIPLALTFTATGTDADDTISKVTFNFGDGQVSDVTTSGGIGTNSVNAQLSHTYTTVGSFQATALLTDSTGNVSDTTNCKQTVTTDGGTTIAATATPTIAATGSTEAIFGFGLAALILIVGGGLLFFVL